MSAWAVSVTNTFLNELLTLPQGVSKKVPKAIKVLEEDPISAQGDAKKLKGYQNNVYRIRLGNYRLFYSFGDGWIKLLSVRKRDDRTYETEIPDFDAPDSPPTELAEWGANASQLPRNNEEYKQQFPFSEPPPVQPDSTPLPVQLTLPTLKQWQIPEQYWELLCRVRAEEELIALSLPDQILGRILDNLFPRPLEEIDTQPEYVLPQPEDLDRFFEGDLGHFLLKLDPEQEKLRDYGGTGPILVKGGPGTGKSTLALYRVKKLLEQGYKPILFTTYTNALVTYSEQLLEQLLDQPPRQAGVEVATVDSLTYRYTVQSNGKPKFASPEQCLSCLESALKTTSIPAKNVFDEQVRRQSLAGLGLPYLLEEILEVIEARGIEGEEAYKVIARTGRKVPLKTTLREALWAVYQTWSALMEDRGYLTWEQLRRKALHATANQITSLYQALVIDEAQDLSPVALRFLLALVPNLRGVYLTADASQSLYQPGFSWKQVRDDLKVAGRTLLLKRNYRNTQQISAACATILQGTEAGDEECLLQHPSPYQGDVPTVLLVNDNDDVGAIQDFLIESAKQHRLPLHGGAILCPTVESAKQYADKLSQRGLSAQFVSSKKIDLKAPYIKTLTLHSAKGLEFPFVAIALSGTSFPFVENDLPSEEVSAVIDAQRRLFYVGCSRAMRALMVCDSQNNPSLFTHSLDTPHWHKQLQ